MTQRALSIVTFVSADALREKLTGGQSLNNATSIPRHMIRFAGQVPCVINMVCATVKPTVEPPKLTASAVLKAPSTTKCRIVAGGHQQSFGTYSEVSAPTVDMSSVFMLLSMNKYLQGDMSSDGISERYLERDHIHEEDEEWLEMVKEKMVSEGAEISLNWLKSTIGLE